MISMRVAVIGAGIAGLTTAITLAEAGCVVTCYDEGGPAASRANFGQWHSGAVYAPVLPDVARACWEHRSRWARYLPATGAARPALGLFASEDRAQDYVRAWERLGIPAEPVNPAGVLSLDRGEPRPVASYVLPDRAVDCIALIRALTSHAMAAGIRIAHAKVRLFCSDSGTTQVIVEGQRTASDLVVICAGAATPDVLTQAGIAHPLGIAYLPYGRIATQQQLGLTYWLDDDLLALSPTTDGVNVALPGRSTHSGQEAEDRNRLVESVGRHWPGLPVEHLVMHRGVVAEPVGGQPDPTPQVVDLRRPPSGWGSATNVVVCLPGKWTTAWKAADSVRVLAGA